MVYPQENWKNQEIGDRKIIRMNGNSLQYPQLSLRQKVKKKKKEYFFTVRDQVFPKFFEGNGHLVFDSFHRNSKLFGNFLIAKFFLLAQQKYFPAFGRKLVNCRVQNLPEFISVDVRTFMFMRLDWLNSPDFFNNLLLSFGVAKQVQTFELGGRKQIGFYRGTDFQLFPVFPEIDENILNDFFSQDLIVEINMNEIAQIVIIPVEEVFKGVDISINHLLYNEEFFGRDFFCQNRFYLDSKLRIILMA